MQQVCKNCKHYKDMPTSTAVLQHPMISNPGKLMGCHANNDVGVTGPEFGEDKENPCPGDFKEKQ